MNLVRHDRFDLNICFCQNRVDRRCYHDDPDLVVHFLENYGETSKDHGEHLVRWGLCVELDSEAMDDTYYNILSQKSTWPKYHHF